MMDNIQVISGTIKSDGTLELAERPNLPPGPVRVTVEHVGPAPGGEGLFDVLERIWADQREHGFQGRGHEEIDAEINALRNEWEDRQEEIDRLHEAAQRASESPPC